MSAAPTAHRLALVTVSQDEARVWNAGLDPTRRPESIRPPEHSHVHVRQAQRHRGHDRDHDEPGFYDAVAGAVSEAHEILLVGHGNGKANHMLRMVQQWERRHPAVAARVVGAVVSDLSAMSEREVLATARDWFDHYHRWGF